MSSSYIIDVKGLKKSFKARKGKKGGKNGGVVEAVKGIDLAVAEGECFGFLGPNGAGKSTTLRMLATLLAPDGGRATIAGYDLLAEPARVRRQIGYVSQAGGADPAATGREDIILQAGLYGLSAEEARERVAELIESLGLAAFADRLTRTYSGGQRRKLDIALGLVHSPKVLFLDEPTTGLDPVSRAQLWERVKQLKRAGTTVFLTTHYLEEADALCDRIAIIDRGSIAAEGTPDELKRRISGEVLSLTVNGSPDAGRIAGEILRAERFVREISGKENKLKLTVQHGGEAIPSVLRMLEGAGIAVADIALSRPSLDDVFLRVTGHSLKEAEESVQPVPAGKGAKS
jgi:ABC-2 type transport system ATP-binding protein